ncbi:MAG: hypothetical protein IJZ34_12480 [Lachnospiraceae bacterium]|nr:hypothetical protein [Lachnospiraceae bacterium]
MKYITGYVRLSDGISRDSILLQQIRYGRCNVVLACVCDGGAIGANMTKQMKLWLAERGPELFEKKSDYNKIRKKLERKLAEWQADVETWMAAEKQAVAQNRQKPGKPQTVEKSQVNLSGILIADQDCWLLQGGESCIYLLNRKFQRTHRSLLSEACYSDWQVTEGRIQKNVGILLGRKEFLQGISKETMMQCLAAQDITREGQIDRRLAELAEESRRQGYESECSGVYIKSV